MDERGLSAPARAVDMGHPRYTIYHGTIATWVYVIYIEGSTDFNDPHEDSGIEAVLKFGRHDMAHVCTPMRATPDCKID